MSRDYKSRVNPPRSTKNKKAPGWIWFLAGLLVGILACSLVWLKYGLEQPVKKQAASSPPTSNKVVTKKPTKAPKPRFDFYTILPEMEVVVTDPDPTKPRQTGISETEYVYRVQMGSFRKFSDADRLKANLALVGVEAEIQKVTIDSGETYHRVRSAPLGGREANRLRSQLQKNNINGLVIKLKK